MPRQPANRNDRPLRIPRWKYDAFLSYSIGADYRQADRIKKFLEGSHNEPGLDIHRLKQLKIFRDGNDLRMAAGGAQPSAAANSQPDDKIKKNFIPYLEQSKTLLILWPGKSAATPFMEWELEEFLRQNRQRGWERKVYLAVTRGEDPAKSSEQFFSRLQLKIGLNGNLFFDLRGQHPAAKGWCKVLDYEYESLRLAVELAGPVDEKNAPLSAGDLFPGWLREKERQRQREEELQRKAFARKAALAGHLLPQSPVTALALAAAVWKTVDTHESRQALAGVLVGTHGLDTHLSRPEAEAHVGPVRDVAFLGDDFLLSIDHGTGAINDERPGALCVWNIAERRFCHREPRMGGTCVLGIGRDRVVVANGSSLIAARWYDDYENRVGFRSRWNFQGSFSVPIEHLAVEPEDELIAAAGGDKLVILRDGDGAFIREWKAPGQIRALAWSGPRTLILGVEETLMTFDVESGRVEDLAIGRRIQDCASGPGGLAVLTQGEVALIRDGAVARRIPVPLWGTAQAIRCAGQQLLVAGGGGSTRDPNLILLNPEQGIFETLYSDFRHALQRLAVSLDGRGVAAARLGDTETARCLPLWNVARWNPLPNAVIPLGSEHARACPLPGTDGFAAAAGHTVSAFGPDGTPRWHQKMGHEIVGLAACPPNQDLVVATSGPSIKLLSARTGKVIRQLGLPKGKDEIVSLVAVAGGRRLLVGWSLGGAMLLDSRDLCQIAAARRQQYEFWGNVTDGKSAARVRVKGGAAWMDHPWVLLHPERQAGQNWQHSEDEQGVRHVQLDSPAPLVGGWGRWNTLTDTLVWSLPGTLGIVEAALIGVGGSSIISPATDAGLGVETHTIVPGPEGSLACPEFRLSMQHGMPDPPMELMASEDGLVVARCYRELLLFSPEEAEPMARMPVPDEFRALTLTGDGARLIARVGQQTVAVCLDPKQWSEEALRRAGRELTPEERQRLLREFDSPRRPAIAQSSDTSR